VKSKNTDVRDRVAKDFLASLMCKGNDVQNYNNVALLSAPYVSAGALSVIPENFDKAMIVHAVRKNIRKNWVNDRDQFMQPNKNPGIGFVRRCTVWNLFSDSNQTSSLRNVLYKGKTYQIVNHFFLFKVSDLRKWKISDSEIRHALEIDSEDRFIAKWLQEQKLDATSEKALKIAREIYKTFFEQFKNLPTSKYKVEHWDAGWWQIRKCLNDTGLMKEEFGELDGLMERLGAGIMEDALELEMITSS
jgi:hypothetical protein